MSPAAQWENARHAPRFGLRWNKEVHALRDTISIAIKSLKFSLRQRFPYTNLTFVGSPGCHVGRVGWERERPCWSPPLMIPRCSMTCLGEYFILTDLTGTLDLSCGSGLFEQLIKSINIWLYPNKCVFIFYTLLPQNSNCIFVPHREASSQPCACVIWGYHPRYTSQLCDNA